MNIDQYRNYFFIGIAGTGMSALAQYLKGTGKNVSGSDRLFGVNNKMLIQEQFESQGIRCFFQDGSGINKETEVVIVSTAIEESNVEYSKAKDMGIPVLKRSELLAAISTSKRTIAVGGTSGKSTTTAMIFHILQENGFSPSLITGAGLTALQKKGLPGNTWVGNSEWLVIEADESDGSIVNYYPEISVVLNIDRDHKEFDELIKLFTTFRDHSHGRFIVNRDYPLLKSLSQNKNYDFGTNEDAGFIGKDFKQNGFRIEFSLQGVAYKIPLIGLFNMENALAATAVSFTVGITPEKAARALESYSGIYRRMQLVGERNGVYVIDDFAHNPAEIAAAVKACQQISKSVTAWYQPHGYGPLRFMHKELAEKVNDILRDSDRFIMSDVYYAGGTVEKDINSDAVITAINKYRQNALFIPNRSEVPQIMKSTVKTGNVILLMGARDPSLSDFATTVLNTL